MPAPIALARNLTLLGAVGGGVAPIDAVFTNFRDLDGLRDEAIAARRDGFSAKMAIHPAQVPIINEVFTPTPEAIARARAIIAAFDAAPEPAWSRSTARCWTGRIRLRAETILARVGTWPGLTRQKQASLAGGCQNLSPRSCCRCGCKDW